MPNKSAIYLRKSRGDTGATIEETLSRHEAALKELAQKTGKKVVHIYREVVSGESISARPQMQQLLQDVEKGEYESVLVMEVERLARGNTIDQGIVAQTFQYTDTEIITPLKTYRPNDEGDEEFFEFGLFMSRREYKTITRRMNRGRIASLKEGKWIANKAPYGYERFKLSNEKGFSLRIVPEEAQIVSKIFGIYVDGYTDEAGICDKNYGVDKIAALLEQHGIINAHGGNNWSAATIRDMLHNPTYAGLIRWGYNPTKRELVDGKMQCTRGVHSDDCQIFQGIHEPIIDKKLYDEAQALTQSRKRKVPINKSKSIINPFAGIVFCSECGKPMRLKKFPNAKSVLLCTTRNCACVSGQVELIEQRVLDTLREWLNAYKLEWSGKAERKVSPFGADKIAAQISRLHTQLDNACELLEQGVYTTELFIARRNKIQKQIDAAQLKYEELTAAEERSAKSAEFRDSYIPKLEYLIETYESLTPEEKNKLLRELLSGVVYTRTQGGRYNPQGQDNFSLQIFPRMPITTTVKQQASVQITS